jgi:hypothetical protein
MASKSRYVRTKFVVGVFALIAAVVPEEAEVADVVFTATEEWVAFEGGDTFTNLAGPKNSNAPLPLNTALLVRGAGSAACFFIWADAAATVGGLIEEAGFACAPGALAPLPAVADEPIAVAAASEIEERLLFESTTAARGAVMAVLSRAPSSAIPTEAEAAARLREVFATWFCNSCKPWASCATALPTHSDASAAQRLVTRSIDRKRRLSTVLGAKLAWGAGQPPLAEAEALEDPPIRARAAADDEDTDVALAAAPAEDEARLPPDALPLAAAALNPELS